jgi:hypothetical protein
VVITACLLVGCSSNTPDGAPPVTTSSADGALAAAGLRRCAAAPFIGRVGSASDPTLSTTVSLLADTHPDVFAGVWWDGAVGQYVFDAVDVVAATGLAEAGLPTGTSYRVDLVPRSFAELRALRDRVMTLDLAGASMFASPRPWDGTVDIGIPVVDDATVNAIAAEFDHDLDAVCVSITGAVSLALSRNGASWASV